MSPYFRPLLNGDSVLSRFISHGKDEACGLLIDFDRAVKMVIEPEGVVNQERRKVTVRTSLGGLYVGWLINL